jgi:hypothetical protein
LPSKLTTTISKIVLLHNSTNSTLINEFHHQQQIHHKFSFSYAISSFLACSVESNSKLIHMIFFIKGDKYCSDTFLSDKSEKYWYNVHSKYAL